MRVLFCMFRACIAVVAVVCCTCFPFGAPRIACKDMRPTLLAPGVGHSARPQTGVSPYTFNYERLSGGAYKVKLAGPSFRGFFIQARDDFDYPIGAFTMMGSGIRPVDCGSVQNAITHSSAQPKTRVVAQWKDVDNIGLKRFLATVVQDKETFWVKLEAQPAGQNPFNTTDV